MYIVTFYGLNNVILKTVKLASKPSFSKLNAMANRIALSYGAHPRTEVISIL